MRNKTHLAILIFLGALIGLFIGSWWSQQGKNVYAIDDARPDQPADCPGDMQFAIIGDFGDAGEPEANVAAMVRSWDVDFIVTVGDNNYPGGEAETIDQNIGQYYHEYIYPYVGDYGAGATENRFWPALGNHDLRTDNAQPYFDYFELPGNERYYDFVEGPVHFFVLNSNPSEVNGRSSDSIQAQWLQTQMLASDARWKIVIMHHTPYTSSKRRKPDMALQWPFAEWGATAVVSGHDHLYERSEANGIPYFVNGAGGRKLYKIGKAEPESRARYNQDYGAMLVQTDQSCINFSFYNRSAELIDSYTIR